MKKTPWVERLGWLIMATIVVALVLAGYHHAKSAPLYTAACNVTPDPTANVEVAIGWRFATSFAVMIGQDEDPVPLDAASVIFMTWPYRPLASAIVLDSFGCVVVTAQVPASVWGDLWTRIDPHKGAPVPPPFPDGDGVEYPGQLPPAYGA